MEFSVETLVIFPIALGLLGFIEPCTIGGHLLFLDTQKQRSTAEKSQAVLVFLVTRSLMAGLFGALITLLGQKLISVQTGIWLFFGLFYVAIGLFFLSGKAGWVKRRIDFAPAKWKTAKSPFVLGLAFGFNIPACAAPILFGLLGLAATTGSVMAGFGMMFLFGLFLSLPLLPFALIPSLARHLDRFAQKLIQMRWIIALVFIGLGLWSIWFGLYVDPKDWSGT
ncbi:MAG: sulfite exporter TauE/SafE family protein [Rhizobiales bacterium]|nr:sulfite exporter TauE/SafE family protein [Hyphomicrobiales bacterium]NRB14926.1 sulfite exporter TauE/SafE family protein [Hyphomicrobiales bacterium]